MEITQYIGITGAVTYLMSYFLLQLGKVDGNGNVYAFLNMLAAIFVMISLTTHFNIGSAIIQVSFISLSLYAIFRSFWMRRSIKLAPLEQALVDVLFPNLPPRQALPLIRKGSWRNEATIMLAREGQPLDSVSVLMTGEACVTKSGKCVAKLGAGQIVGEVSWRDNSPATADVTVKKQAHYFSISSNHLRKFLAKNTDAAAAFDAGLRNQLVRKLA
jgi:hypothetical protein